MEKWNKDLRRPAERHFRCLMGGLMFRCDLQRKSMVTLLTRGKRKEARPRRALFRETRRGRSPNSSAMTRLFVYYPISLAVRPIVCDKLSLRQPQTLYIYRILSAGARNSPRGQDVRCPYWKMATSPRALRLAIAPACRRLNDKMRPRTCKIVLR